MSQSWTLEVLDKPYDRADALNPSPRHRGNALRACARAHAHQIETVDISTLYWVELARVECTLAPDVRWRDLCPPRGRRGQETLVAACIAPRGRRIYFKGVEA